MRKHLKSMLLTTLIVCSYNIYSQCVTGTTVTATPPPVNGQYEAGTEVELCLLVTGYVQISSNWLHSVTALVGTGWDATTLSSSGAPPSSCSGSGFWDYYEDAITSSASGIVTQNDGWFYETSSGNSSGVQDDDPGNNYGDNISGLCNGEFCFSITVGDCPPAATGDDLIFTFEINPDAETGSWGPDACFGDIESYVAEIICCEVPDVTASNDGPACPGDLINLSVDIASGGGPPIIVWNGPSVTDGVGNPYTIANPVGGTYVATVTVDGCSSEVETEVAVVEAGVASWTTGSVCVGETLELIPDNLGGTWTGPGVVNNGDGTASILGTIAGTFPITYTISASGCPPESVTQNVIIIDSSLPPASWVEAGLCIGQDLPAELTYPLIPPGFTLEWYADAALTYFLGDGPSIPTPTDLINNGLINDYTFIIVLTNPITGCTSPPAEYTFPIIYCPCVDPNTLLDDDFNYCEFIDDLITPDFFNGMYSYTETNITDNTITNLEFYLSPPINASGVPSDPINNFSSLVPLNSCDESITDIYLYIHCDILGNGSDFGSGANSDDQYIQLGSFTINIFPDIGDLPMAIGSVDGCDQFVVQYDCDNLISNYVVTNDIDGNGTHPDIDAYGIDTGTVTFTLTNLSSPFFEVNTPCGPVEVPAFFDCSCPEIDDPDINETISYCVGTFPVADLIVSAPPTGYTTYWYNTSAAITPVFTGNTYAPFLPGTYYVQYFDNDECYSNLIPVEVTPYDDIALDIMGSICEFEDLDGDGNFDTDGVYNDTLHIIGGSGHPFMVTNDEGFIIEEIDSVTYVVHDIPHLNDYTVTIEDSAGCASGFPIDGFDCGCPPPGSSPDNPLGGEICNGAPMIPVSVTPPADIEFYVVWYSDSALTDSLAVGDVYLPAAPGIYYTIYTNGECDSNPAAAEIIEYEPLTMDTTYTCSQDGWTYDLMMTINGGSQTDIAVIASGFTVNSISSNEFSIADIAEETGITGISVTDDHGCTGLFDIDPFDCGCPLVPDPTNPVPTVICEGDTGYMISVDDVVAPYDSYQVYWYDNPFGITPIATGAELMDAAVGTYWAQYNDGLGCETGLVAVEIDQYPVMAMVSSNSSCSADNFTFDYDFQIAGGADDVYSLDIGTLVADIVVSGSGNYELNNISSPQPDMTITVTNVSSGCSQDFILPEVDCGCPIIGPPLNPVNAQVCPGLAPNIPVSVDVSQYVNYQVQWYTDDTGTGTLLGTGEDFIPTSIGTYYAQYVNVNDANCVSPFTTAQITEYAVLDLFNDFTCSADNFTFTYSLTATGGADGTYSIDAPVGMTVNETGVGQFEITDISSPQAGFDVTVTDGQNCSEIFTLPAQDCGCYVIDPPIDPVDNAHCPGSPVPDISVGVVQYNDYQVEWFNTDDGTGASLSTGITFTPPAPGIYYAQYVSTLDPSCVSDYTPAELVEHPQLELSDSSHLCAADNYTFAYALTFTGGSDGTYSLTNTGGFQVNDLGSGQFEIIDIPSPQAPFDVTVTDGASCSLTVPLNQVDCGCYVVAIPQLNSLSETICNGDVYPTFSTIAPPAGYTTLWSDQQDMSNIITTGEVLTPTAAGTYYVVFDDGQGCQTSPIAVALIELAPITAVAVEDCAADNVTYDYNIQLSGGAEDGYSISITEGYNIVDNGSGSFTIEGIGSPSAITITATTTVDVDGTQLVCSDVIPFAEINCGCHPQPEPTGPVDEIICDGADPVAVAVDGPPAGMEIHWFDGDDLETAAMIGTGETYLPSDVGTFYAATLNDTCYSEPIAVMLESLPPILMVDSAHLCTPDNLFYDVELTVSGGSGSGYVADSPTVDGYVVTDLGAGNFRVEDMPQETTTVVVIRDDADCEVTIDIASVYCGCPPIAEPLAPADTEFCNGTAVPQITITDSAVGYDVYWFSDLAMTDQLQQGVSYGPSGAGIYYIAFGDGQCFGLPTEVVVNEIPPLSILSIDTECSLDRQSFNLTITVEGGTGTYDISNSLTYNYVQDSGNTFTVQGIQNNASGTIELTDDFGCITTMAIPDLDCDIPCSDINADVTELYSLCEDDPVGIDLNTLLESQASGNGVWSTSPGNELTSTMVIPSQMGQGTYGYHYTVQPPASDPIYCEPEVGQLQISILDCTQLTWVVPSAFSPNNDSVNDLFRVVWNTTVVNNYEMMLFDRWGQELFRSIDQQEGWDGDMPNGEKGEVGVYVFWVKVILPNGQEQLAQGNFTLVR